MKKGLFIPYEIMDIEGLSDDEYFVISVYWNYTVYIDQHCCTLTNKEVCRKARIKDERTLPKIKKHLEELGLIRTDGDTNVYYVGDSRGDKNDILV